LKALLISIFYPQIWYSSARETGQQIVVWRGEFDSVSYCLTGVKFGRLTQWSPPSD